MLLSPRHCLITMCDYANTRRRAWQLPAEDSVDPLNSRNVTLVASTPNTCTEVHVVNQSTIITLANVGVNEDHLF
jgi:hypothetical protein